jgi:VanZ family protein
MLNAPPLLSRGRLKRAQSLTVWIAPAAWAALIFYLSSLPGSTVPSPFFAADKIFHLVIYAVLGYLVARALVCHGWKRRALVMLALLLCLLYGASDEMHQSFVPDRTPSFMDLAADAVGSFIGIVIRARKR